MRKLKFVNGECYHVYNRGVEKRDVFLDERDYFRFLISIKGVNHFGANDFLDACGPEDRPKVGDERKREALVEMICYCLMPNHFHFVLKQNGEGGVPKFMQKLCTAYTMYFNKKNERTGVLFQGPYKAKHVDGDQYLLQVSRYIHLNPLDLLEGEESEAEFLKNYKWSSLQFYLDEKRHSLVHLKKGLLAKQFSNIPEFARFTLNNEGVISEEFLALKID